MVARLPLIGYRGSDNKLQGKLPNTRLEGCVRELHCLLVEAARHRRRLNSCPYAYSFSMLLLPLASRVEFSGLRGHFNTLL